MKAAASAADSAFEFSCEGLDEDGEIDAYSGSLGEQLT
jgi:hypothetical protein